MLCDPLVGKRWTTWLIELCDRSIVASCECRLSEQLSIDPCYMFQMIWSGQEQIKTSILIDEITRALGSAESYWYSIVLIRTTRIGAARPPSHDWFRYCFEFLWPYDTRRGGRQRSAVLRAVLFCAAASEMAATSFGKFRVIARPLFIVKIASRVSRNL